MGPIAYILFLMQYILAELTIGHTDDAGVQNYKMLTSATGLGTSCFPENQLIMIPSCKRIKMEIKYKIRKVGEERRKRGKEKKENGLEWVG